MVLPLGPVHHVAILVDDLVKAERFYAGVLGLGVERRWPDSAGGTRSVWLSLGGDARLMLERAAPGDARRGAMGGGWHVLALSIRAEDRPAVEAALSGAGFPVESRTENTLYARDPEGNRIAFSHWPAKAP